MRGTILGLLIIPLHLGFVTPTVYGQDSYFVVLFGAQRPFFKQPRTCHSFAVFLHQRENQSVESFAISWLPASGRVRPFALIPEMGKNWTLPETMDYCQANRMEITTWGPYEIDAELWQRAVQQKEWLESGNVAYRAFDSGSVDGTISNCIHAISFMARQPGQKVPFVFVAPANWGESGTYWVSLTLRPWFVEPCNLRLDLLAELGLDPRNLRHGALERNPSSSLSTRLVQAILHRKLLPNRVSCP